MAKVTFVRPPLIDRRLSVTSVTCPHVGLAYVAGSARAAGHDITVIDALGEAPTQTTELPNPLCLARGLSPPEILDRVPPETDVLAITCMFSQDWPHLRSILYHLRRRFRGVPIIAGGEHITAMPDFVLNEGVIDHCVLGEGEETFVDLLAALGSGRSLNSVPGIVTRVGGKIVRTPPRTRIASVDDIPPPAWDAFPLENYFAGGYGFGVNRGRSMPILATRGCPYQCTFCSSPTMWTTRWVARDPAEVLEEMRGYIERYRAENFDFYDLTAIIKREWILKFGRLVLASDLKFTWQLPTGTRSEAIDDEVATILYRTGCRNITYAPESGAPSELRRIRKRVKLERMKDSMRACTRRGLKVKTNIVLGFPGQTKRELLGTMRFLVEMAVLGVRDTNVSLFSPYPGSEMYRELRAAGKVGEPDDEYFHSLACYNDLGSTNSWTEHLSARQLAAARALGMLLFYSVGFLVRPWRGVQTIVHIVRDREESPLERTLAGLWRRIGREIRRKLALLGAQRLPRAQKTF